MTLARTSILDGLPAFPGAYTVATLTGDRTIAIGDAFIQKLDPGGAARTVTLPANDEAEGAFFLIINAADAAEDITVDDSEGNDLATLGQNESGLFYLTSSPGDTVCVVFTTSASVA